MMIFEGLNVGKTAEKIPTKTIQKLYPFRDEAEWAARDFLAKGLKACTDRPIELKWMNLEGDLGQVGVVTSGGKIVATVTVLNFGAGGATIAGTIFGSK